MSSTGQRLGEIVLARRQELELNQLEVWQAGGPSNTTLTEIENGRLETLTRNTARKLDKGLQWEPGSARRAWDGGEPTPLLATVSSELSGRVPDLSAKLRRLIEESDMDQDTRGEMLALVDEIRDVS